MSSYATLPHFTHTAVPNIEVVKERITLKSYSSVFIDVENRTIPLPIIEWCALHMAKPVEYFFLDLISTVLVFRPLLWDVLAPRTLGSILVSCKFGISCVPWEVFGIFWPCNNGSQV